MDGNSNVHQGSAKGFGFRQPNKTFSDRAVAVLRLGSCDRSHRHLHVSELYRRKNVFNISNESDSFRLIAAACIPERHTKELTKRGTTVCNNGLAATGTAGETNRKSFFKQQVIFIYKLGKGLPYIEQKGNKIQEIFPRQQ